MNYNIRLIALDLDDTLLNTEMKICQENIAAIEVVREKGVYVTIATGRMFSSAKPYIKQLQLQIPVITYQGALIVNPVTEETVYHCPVPKDLAIEIATQCEEMGYHLNSYFNDEIYVEKMSKEAEYYQRIANVPMKVVGKLSNFIEDDPTKLVVVANEAKIDQLKEKWSLEFGDKLYLTKSKPNFLEIMDNQVNKGIGILKVAKSLGIENTQEIMTIGDSYNDLPMFDIAGVSVAMGNSRDEVKAKAKYVTNANSNSGVAAAIKEFLL